MEHFTSGTGHAVGHGKQRHANATGFAVLCLVLCFTVVSAALVNFAGRASATTETVAARAAGVRGIPAAQGTAPVPINTGQVPPVQTGGVGPVDTAGPVTGNQGATADPVPGDGFPWWVLAPLLLGLGAVAYLVARRRQPVEVVAAGPPPSQRPYMGATTGTTTTATSVSTTGAVAGAVAPVASAAGAVGAAGATGQIACPNCGAANDPNENFCHDCGQDLRPVRAQMFAPAVDVVDEYTPYLETLSRVDEQLEYVLSRAVVTVGTAPGNDIVIDAAFNGSATVSGVHAELRRESDGFSISDRGSEAGVYVNGERVNEAALKDGDEVRIGDAQFVYRAPARPARP